MGFLSHRVSRSNLEAGDHIYTWRTAFTYSHHGIYVGGGKVVHFTQDHYSTSSDHSSFISSSVSTTPETCLDSTSSHPSSLISSSDSVSPETLDFPHCGFRKHESGVTMSCLNCFTGNGSVYRFEYGASCFAFVSKLRGGTCTTAKSDPPEDVLHRATYLLHNGFGAYDLFSNNCEDFALYCKTGLLVRGKTAQEGSSGQATSVIGVPVAAILSLPLRVFVSNPVVIGTFTAVNYSVTRYANDIGVRIDVVKVDVEEMGVCNGNRSGEGDVDDAWPKKEEEEVKVDAAEMGVCNGNRSGEGDVDSAWPKKEEEEVKVDVEEMGVCNGNRSGEGDVGDAWPKKEEEEVNVDVEEVGVCNGNRSGEGDVDDAWPKKEEEEVNVDVEGMGVCNGNRSGEGEEEEADVEGMGVCNGNRFGEGDVDDAWPK